MYTVFSDIVHAISRNLGMPTLTDDLGNGAIARRRQQQRPLGRWEIATPPESNPGAINQLMGLIEYLQGDSPFWWDGGGFGEVHDPVIVGFGDGVTTDIMLPQRFWYVASTVIYVDATPTPAWAPLAGDGIVMDSIRISPAPPANAQITAKGRRRIKVVVDTEQDNSHQSIMEDLDRTRSVYAAKYFLQEVAV